MHNELLHKLCCSLGTIRVIKSRKVGLTGYAEPKWELKKYIRKTLV
jgi:hypothetical protein